MGSEKQLLKKAIKGNRKAQYALYEMYAPMMLAVCMRYSKKKSEAEDVLQEGFVKVFNKLADFRGEASLKTWIKKIMINTALNYHRAKIHDCTMLDIDQMYDLSDESFVFSDYSFGELLELLHKLPDRARLVFNLFAIEGYSHKEIAEKLNINVGTSKSQYARARGLLKNMLRNTEIVRYERKRNVL